MLEHEKNIVRMVSEGFVAWCADASPAARLERTIAQGLIGVAIGIFTGFVGAPEWIQVGIVPVVMVMLAPIQAQIGKSLEEGA